MIRVSLSFLAISLSVSMAFGQHVDGNKIRVDSRKALRIEYASPGWNRSPDKADSSFLLLRDSESGKNAKIQMTETGNNTGLFRGDFQIRFSTEATDSTPEVYIIPRKLEADISKLEDLIKQGSLIRKPYFFRIESGSQVLTIFESKNQAVQSYETFLKSSKVTIPTPTSEYGKSGANLQAVDAAAVEAKLRAEAAAEKARLEKLAADAAAERKRMEEDEIRRKEEMKRKAQEMAKEERAKRIREAKMIAEEGMVAFRAGDFALAEKKFAKSIELDPENRKTYFQHGISLYRTEQWNRAVVTLRLADVAPENEAEKEYIMGLCLMKTNDLNGAKASFIKAKGLANEKISPIAGLYAGIADFQLENFEESKSHFEWVLETSDDPTLDAQADAYIEQIANALQFKKKTEHRWSATLNLGMIYDSNILNQNASNTTTGLSGYRGLYGGQVEYRAVYTPEHELIPTLVYNDLYSMNSSFAAEKIFQDTDPLLFGFNMPWKWKGKLFGSPAFTGITPGWESVRLNVDTAGTRETISHSYYVRNDMTLAPSEGRYANYYLELRQDVSTTQAATTADDSSAFKATLGTAQTFFTDKKMTTAWIIDGAIATNAAKGDNNKYTRLDLGGTYLFPGIFDSTWTARLGGFNSKYPSHASSRADTNLSVTIGMSKSLTPALTGTFSATHAKNGSNVTSNEYSKTTIMAMLSWSGILW